MVRCCIVKEVQQLGTVGLISQHTFKTAWLKERLHDVAVGMQRSTAVRLELHGNQESVAFIQTGVCRATRQKLQPTKSLPHKFVSIVRTVCLCFRLYNLFVTQGKASMYYGFLFSIFHSTSVHIIHDTRG